MERIPARAPHLEYRDRRRLRADSLIDRHAQRIVRGYSCLLYTSKIDPDKIGKIIGPGGKVIRAMQEQYGVKIDIEDDGSVFVSAPDGTKIQGAIAQIEAMTEEATIGRIYTGTVSYTHLCVVSP